MSLYTVQCAGLFHLNNIHTADRTNLAFSTCHRQHQSRPVTRVHQPPLLPATLSMSTSTLFKHMVEQTKKMHIQVPSSSIFAFPQYVSKPKDHREARWAARYRSIPALSIKDLVEVLNSTPNMEKYGVATFELKKRIWMVWKMLMHPLEDSALPPCSEEDRSTYVDGIRQIVEHLRVWPASLAQEEHAACLVMLWIANIMPFESCALLTSMKQLASVWRDGLPTDEAQLTAHVQTGRLLVTWLDALLFVSPVSEHASRAGGELAIIREGSKKWADKVSHSVYYLMKEFVAAVYWESEVFKKDRRVEWVRCGLLRGWGRLRDVAEKEGKVERWSEEPQW